MPLRLYNTLTKRVEEFVANDPSSVTFYTCGPTVYDDAHIGNFRSFLAADLLRRFVESPLCELGTREGGLHQGPRCVTHVMNITDVGHMTDDAEGGEAGEDRMAVAGRRIAEAKKAGMLPAGVEVDPRDPYAIAKFYEGRFREDARRLGLKVSIEAEKDESLHPKATAHVSGMIAVIARLVASGYAYVGGRPGARAVYFDVQKYEPYGRLSGNTLERLRAGEGGRVSASNQAEKKHPADFLLWKEDPSHIMKWESPWGWGYPGWHIECSVMSFRARGASANHSPAALGSLVIENGQPLIDLHSGGEDNIFPHHECEMAQSCCAFNADPAAGSFASMWFHPRFLLVEGTKMSKSKGNFFTARDLFAKGVEPAALRLELIKTHYRSNANFTMQGLADSQKTVERWRAFAAGAEGEATAVTAENDASESVRQFLCDDLNVAGAIAAMNSMIRPGAPATLVRQFVECERVLGVLALGGAAQRATELGVFVGVPADEQVEMLLVARRDARARKDFKASDAIRDQLAGMGYAIKDMAGGKVEVRRA